MRAGNTSYSSVDLRRVAGAALWCVALLAGCFSPPRRPLPAGRSLEGIPAARLEPSSPWTGWDDAREPLVTFEFARGWTVECAGDVKVTLTRVADRETAGRHAARLTADGAGPVARALLRPPMPIPIPEPFDTIELRVGVGGGAAPARGARPFVRVVLETAEKSELSVHLGRFPESGWSLAHRRLTVEEPLAGARLTGIEIVNWPEAERQPLYLTGLTFYTENRAPIVPEWRLERENVTPLALLAADEAWQAAADAALPPSPELPAESRLDIGNNRAEFAYVEDGVRVAYRLRFESGPGAVEVKIGDLTLGALDPIVWERETGRPTADRPVIARQREDGAMALEFESGRRLLVRLAGRSLVMEIASDARDTAYVECPRFWSADALPVSLAFLNALGWSGPPVWVTRTDDGQAWAACAYLEPRFSHATEWVMPPRESGSAPAVAPPALRAVYEPSAFGRRAPVRERLVFTVSRRLADVLPGVGRRPAGDMPPPLSPDVSSDVVDHDELQPLDAAWSRDLLRRNTEGQWVAGRTPGAFAVKWPLIELLQRRDDRQSGDAGQEKSDALPESGTTNRLPMENPPASRALEASLTAYPPWLGVDFDPRTPAAAQFNAARFGLIRWLRTAKRESGRPVIGRDDWIWLWADALDGWRVSPQRAAALLTRPALPHFSRMRLSAIGHGLLPSPPPDAPDAEWDRWSAALLWYGLSPGIGAESDAPGAARARRCVEALLRRTRGRAPERIAFSVEGRLTDATDAIAAGALDGGGRMYLRFTPDLELWVRCDERAGEWRVSVGGEDWLLPPHGWVARGEGLWVFSGMINGHRADYVEEGATVWFDPRGAEMSLRDVAADGPVSVRRERTPRGWAWDVEPGASTTRVAVRRMSGDPFAYVSVAAYGAHGGPLDASPVEKRGQWLFITIPAGAARIRVECQPAGTPK